LGHLLHPIAQTRRDLQARRAELGTEVADAMTEWATEVLARRRPGEKYTVVSFYNSSSYRNERPIDSGDITGATIWAAYSFRSRPRVALIKGHHLAALFRALRLYRLKSEVNPARQYTPQMGSNLVEREDFGLHLYDGESARPLDPDETYALALDGWLAKNKYGIDEWARLIQQVEWVDDDRARLQTEVLEEFLPRRLESLSVRLHSCAHRTASAR
jgi:2',3'-cyclic-nucleotide 2'-phosphodiesterase (5'-nucleotidase family)